MTTTNRTSDPASDASSTCTIDMNLEVVVVPVSDPDRAKAFYESLGWRLDADRDDVDGIRLIQFTPPGSGCSIQFGKNASSAAPGSSDEFILIVSDVEAARQELVDRGVDVTAVYHCETGTACRFEAGSAGRVNGLAPDGSSYHSFASFRDPDGNRWIVQEVTARLAGRVDPDVAAYHSVDSLRRALVRASTAHGEHEKRLGESDADWPTWYARYMMSEETGAALPE